MSMLVQRSSGSTRRLTLLRSVGKHGIRHTGLTSEKAEIPERVGT